MISLEQQSSRLSLRSLAVGFVGSIAALVGLVLVYRYSFLLFHGLVEVFSVAVAWCIFALAWNTRHLADNKFLLLLGISYFFIGGINLLHALAYKGMGVFPNYDADLPTQLWIAMRYLLGVSLLGGLYLSHLVKDGRMLIRGFAVVTGLLLLSIFLRVFPQCYIEGQGLTPFKIGSEYFLCMVFVVSIITVVRKKAEFFPTTYWYLIVSMVCMIIAGLFFTFYVSVFGLSNILGHFFSLISVYFIYKALVENSLTNPFQQLFNELREAEIAREDVDRILRHELKSPLMGIIGLPRLMATDENLTAEQRKMLGLIESAGLRMKRQVDTSLDIYHIERGTYGYEPEPVDIIAVLGEIRREFKQSQGDRTVLLTLDGRSVNPGDHFTIPGHPAAMRMLLGNLMLNALEASGKDDAVKVRITSGTRVVIQLWNSRPVPTDMRDRFFEKYTTFGKSNGTGLGTYTARLAARAMGGEVTMETDDARGTTVTVTLSGTEPTAPA